MSESKISPLTWISAGAALCGGAAVIGKYYHDKKKEFTKRNIRADRVRTISEDYIPPQEGKLTVAKSFGDSHNPIFKVVLTGGPCAGKTTAMCRLSNFLRQRGYRVFTVPEAATMMFSNGATFDDCNTFEKLVAFQGNLLETQVHLEDMFTNLGVSTGEPTVLLCDRGCMDGKAYIEDDVWQAILDRNKTDNVTLRDNRYNMVIHMVTAADGAEEFYTLENNETRIESKDEAITQDRKTQSCWTGHPSIVVVDNSSDFNGKLERVVEAVSNLVGLPGSRRRYKRFLIANDFDPSKLSVDYEIFDVEKVYLAVSSLKEGEYEFIRRRKKKGGLSCYGHTTVNVVDGQKIERKRIITSKLYNNLRQKFMDLSRRVVRQRRVCFLYRGRFYEIYKYADLNISILNIQYNKGETIDMSVVPPCIGQVDDITETEDYSAYRLSTVDYMGKHSSEASPLFSNQGEIQEDEA